jgi:hypothetical protein
MMRTETELRAALRAEVEALTFDVSVAALRRRGLRHRAAPVALTAAVVLVLVATAIGAQMVLRGGRATTPASPGVSASPSAEVSPRTALPTRDRPARTGVTMRDGRELVFWAEDGITLGGRDAQGTVKQLEITSVATIDWLAPNFIVGDPHFADGAGDTKILVVRVAGTVQRLTGVRGGQIFEVPMIRTSDVGFLWLEGQPSSHDTCCTMVTAYDAGGKALGTVGL